MQSAVTNYVSYTFSSCFTFVRVCCRIVCAYFNVLITFSRYDFSFDHVFRVHLLFNGYLFVLLTFFVYVFRVLGGDGVYPSLSGGGGGGGVRERKLVVL